MTRQLFGIGGLACAGCARGLEGRLKALPGVRSAGVHYLTASALIDWDEAVTGPEALRVATARAGYRMTDADLTAIARYLKSLTPREGREEWRPNEDLTTATLRAGDFTAPGALTYVEHCTACHRLDGMGAPQVYPALKGNSMVFADDPSSLIQITLAGGRMPETPAHPMTFVMPGFAHLTNADLAELMTYIRNSWGNHASPVTEADIARMRHEIANKPIHYAPEAGR